MIAYMGLFTSKPTAPDVGIPKLIDFTGEWAVDDEYIQLGLKEGWLTRIGNYRLNGILYITYCESRWSHLFS